MLKLSSPFAPPRRCVLLVGLIICAHGSAYAAKTATRDEYRNCVNTGEALKLARKQVDQEQADLKRQKMAFIKQQDVIASEGAALDATDQAKVDAHNLKIDDANKVGAAFNAANDQGNERQAKFNADADRHNKACGSLAVTVGDKAAVKKELEKK